MFLFLLIKNDLKIVNLTFFITSITKYELIKEVRMICIIFLIKGNANKLKTIKIIIFSLF